MRNVNQFVVIIIIIFRKEEEEEKQIKVILTLIECRQMM